MSDESDGDETDSLFEDREGAEHEEPEREETDYDATSDDTDAVSAAWSEETDPEKEYELDYVLAEHNLEVPAQHDPTSLTDADHYLVKWKGYSIYKSTFEPCSEFTAPEETLRDWEEEKKRVESGSQKPFDIDSWAVDLRHALAKKARYHQRKNKKRVRLGLPVKEYPDDVGIGPDRDELGRNSQSHHSQLRGRDPLSESEDSEDDVPLSSWSKSKRRKTIQGNDPDSKVLLTPNEEDASTTLDARASSAKISAGDDGLSQFRTALNGDQANATAKASKTQTTSHRASAPNKKRSSSSSQLSYLANNRTVANRTTALSVNTSSTATDQHRSVVNQQDRNAKALKARKTLGSQLTKVSGKGISASRPFSSSAVPSNAHTASKHVPATQIFGKNWAAAASSSNRSVAKKAYRTLSHRHNARKKAAQELAPRIENLRLFDTTTGVLVSEPQPVHPAQLGTNMASRDEFSGSRTPRLVEPSSRSNENKRVRFDLSESDEENSGFLTCFFWLKEGLECRQGHSCALKHQHGYPVARFNVSGTHITCSQWLEKGHCIWNTDCDFAHNITRYVRGAQPGPPIEHLDPEVADAKVRNHPKGEELINVAREERKQYTCYCWAMWQQNRQLSGCRNTEQDCPFAHSWRTFMFDHRKRRIRTNNQRPMTAPALPSSQPVSHYDDFPLSQPMAITRPSQDLSPRTNAEDVNIEIDVYDFFSFGDGKVARKVYMFYGEETRWLIEPLRKFFEDNCAKFYCSSDSRKWAQFYNDHKNISAVVLIDKDICLDRIYHLSESVLRRWKFYSLSTNRDTDHVSVNAQPYLEPLFPVNGSLAIFIDDTCIREDPLSVLEIVNYILKTRPQDRIKFVLSYNWIQWAAKLTGELRKQEDGSTSVSHQVDQSGKSIPRSSIVKEIRLRFLEIMYANEESRNRGVVMPSGDLEYSSPVYFETGNASWLALLMKCCRECTDSEDSETQKEGKKLMVQWYAAWCRKWNSNIRRFHFVTSEKEPFITGSSQNFRQIDFRAPRDFLEFQKQYDARKRLEAPRD